jgi:uncharacterized repeat protein (TIGR03833 family)
MTGQQRKDIRPGARVEIVLKQDQRSGKRTVGVVKDILTSSAYHSRGIKVRLEDGRIGRVQAILADEAQSPRSSESQPDLRKENNGQGGKE